MPPKKSDRGLARAFAARPAPIVGLQAPAGYRWTAEAPLDEEFCARSGFSAEAATISIFDYIGEDGFSDRRMSGALRAIGPRAVEVEINSPGGDYFQGVAIYNMLRRHKGAVTVSVMGIAASAASLLAMAADEVLIARNAEIMIHNASGLAFGDRRDMARTAAVLGKLDRDMAATYAAKMGGEVAEASALMDAETFFSGAEAVDAGIADRILDEDAEAVAYAASADAPARDLRTWDRMLAESGISRANRRALFRDLTDSGTPSAADDGTPGAADLIAALTAITLTLKG